MNTKTRFIAFDFRTISRETIVRAPQISLKKMINCDRLLLDVFHCLTQPARFVDTGGNLLPQQTDPVLGRGHLTFSWR